MGAYYTWVNASKQEYFSSMPFAYGFKILENCRYPNDRTDAVLTLIASEWRGDLVAFVSDYSDLSDEKGNGLARISALLTATPCEYVEENGTDICGRFPCARGEEGLLDVSGRPGEKDWQPYDGPFDLEPTVFRYVVNETRGEYLDRENGHPLGILPNGTQILEDVFPALMGDVLRSLKHSGELCQSGVWIGDLIRPTNDTPDPSYREITREYTIWS